MQRAKTVKRIKTIINSVGAPPPIQQTQAPQAPLDFLQNMEKGMDAFFTSENKNTLKRPWIKLDRALRIDRLRTFANDYKDITAEEKTRLTQCLLSSLDRGLLKTRQIVNYNTETCKIDEIKGLIIQTTDTVRSFKVELPRATKRRTRVPVLPTLGILEGQEQTTENATEK
jgi:hypothetical protein